MRNTTEAGWPRPFADLDDVSARAYPEGAAPVRVPMPWMNVVGSDGYVDWFTCRQDSAHVHVERACQTCGEPLGAALMLPRAYIDRQTNGGGVHPRCMALALRFCPHFPTTPGAHVAYAYVGDGVGYVLPDGMEDDDPDVHEMSRMIAAEAVGLSAEQVREIARIDPEGAQAIWATSDVVACGEESTDVVVCSHARRVREPA